MAGERPETPFGAAPRRAPPEGDPPASFEELVRRCADKAYNFAYRLSGNEQDARDLVQEAFARALRHRNRYDPSRPWEAWLLRILRNVYLDGVRRYAARRTVSLDAPATTDGRGWDDVLPAAEDPPVEALIRGESDEAVQKALEALPLPYRTAVALCDVERLSYKRIAEVMGCPVGTVRSRIHQGRLLLRRALSMSGTDE